MCSGFDATTNTPSYELDDGWLVGDSGEWISSTNSNKRFGCTDSSGRIYNCDYMGGGDNCLNPADEGVDSEIFYKEYCNWGCGYGQNKLSSGFGNGISNIPIQNLAEFQDHAIFYCAKDSGEFNNFPAGDCQ